MKEGTINKLVFNLYNLSIYVLWPYHEDMNPSNQEIYINGKENLDSIISPTYILGCNGQIQLKTSKALYAVSHCAWR